jgi:hypothetical protein
MTDETIEPSLAESRSRDDEWRQRYFEARDALFQFKYPPDPKLLREIADEIDCGNDCAHGYTEWDTNAHVCSRSERKEGCAGEKASCLRQFADAIDARSRAAVDPTGGVTSPDYVMDKDTDAKLFAAALYVISGMWGNEMGDLQRASLANQIVREIERRGIVMPAAAAEPPSSGDGANTDYVMVPRKASDEMVEQARMTLPGIVDICDADIEDIYETMIAAAPPHRRHAASLRSLKSTPDAEGE